MLFLLRKIRRKLMEKNKFTTYLIYAAGEIVLVVLGILIAVSINNWNQERKQLQVAKYYLESLQEDFVLNDSIANHLMEFNQFQADNALLLLKCFENGIKKDQYHQFYVAFNHVYFINHLKYEQGTWQELISTGNLALIQSTSLKQMLKEFYSEVQKFDEIEIEWTQNNTKLREIHSKVTPIKSEDLRKVAFTIGLTGILKDTTGFSNPSPVIKELASINEEWFALRSVNLSRRYIGVRDQMRFRSNAQAILSALEEELSKY